MYMQMLQEASYCIRGKKKNFAKVVASSESYNIPADISELTLN